MLRNKGEIRLDKGRAAFFPALDKQFLRNPRALGFEDELISPVSEIWNCTNCYTCSERCPQDVRPVDVIIALKNLCIAEGKAPDIVLTVSDAVLAAGITTKVTALIERRRKELGLSPIKEYPLDDLKKITGKD